MKRKTTILYLLLIVLSWSCESTQSKVQTSPESQEETISQIDTLNAVKIGHYWAKPKESFEFNTLGESKGDTITFVTCSDYVFSPFGEVNNKTQLRTSLLKNFSMVDRIDTLDNEAFEFQILTLKNSRLILFFDDSSEGSRGSYIHKGEIMDTEVNLSDNVKIGMSKKDFIMTFFDNFPDEALSTYNHFVFESCVTDIWHTYTFTGDKLQSIKFTTDSYWVVDYMK
ncbi:hypothetical protein AHMF7605_27055 [Adhaeribacter arboris]|uniref:Uncharacterized protein n=1 Tax=Adhaeribacter arboris TaxID=2072846 RepID=A0A2T2YN20_9BACT|nr:hypothetical protein [Adhaeribacter arboris]PSR56895.1 hypothetical protein AHMF7605_27055 [Adhaeribacter arboris]